MFIFIEICIFGMFYAYLPLFILGSIINIINIINFYLYTKIEYQRNDKGLEILGKINGFKKYLETVEKEKIKSMIQENPNYFYDILPYAYVLDVSKKWIENFENIPIPTNDMGNFNYRDVNSLDTLSSSIYYPSSSSSSGGDCSSCGGGCSSCGGGGSW